MTKTISKILSVILFFISISTNAQNPYQVEKETAIIHWKGFKPTGNHYGILKLKDGVYLVNDNKITGGEFTMDMNSITDIDMPADNPHNTKLVGHLKSEAFFGVAKYPTAIFKITETQEKGDKTLIKGNLTIKDITNSIEFLATVKLENDKLTFKSDTFKIDRSKWHIKFKSKSFFESLGDNFIYDKIEISIELIANKQI